MRFDSKLTNVAPVPSFPADVVREEPGQCRVSCEQAEDAGPVHRAFLAALPSAWREDAGVEIFSRLLWLRAGWYPLRPFFHLDWGASEQAPGRVETLVASFGGASHTEFVHDAFDLEDGPGAPSYGQQVEALVQGGSIRTRAMENHTLCHFDNATWHRATPAKATGWRLLIRAIRGLDHARRHDGAGTFTSVRNGYLPLDPEEIARHAPYEV